MSSIGDSLVVVADDEIIKVHVHTDHPGMAIEKALTIGSLSGLKIDNMREQHTNKIDFHCRSKPVNRLQASILKSLKKSIRKQDLYQSAQAQVLLIYSEALALML